MSRSLKKGPFIDTALLADMLEFMRESHAKFVSLPDAFTPYFAGKVYSRALLDEVGAAIRALPGDQAIHFARYAAFIEQNRARFSAVRSSNALACWRRATSSACRK